METAVLKIAGEYNCDPWMQASAVGLIESCLAHLQQAFPNATLDDEMTRDDRIVEGTFVGLEDDDCTLAGHQLLHFMLHETKYRVSSMYPVADSKGTVLTIFYTFVYEAEAGWGDASH